MGPVRPPWACGLHRVWQAWTGENRFTLLEETLWSKDVPHEPLERNLQMSSIELCQIVFVFILKYVQCMQRNTAQKVFVTKPLGVVNPGR